MRKFSSQKIFVPKCQKIGLKPPSPILRRLRGKIKILSTWLKISNCQNSVGNCNFSAPAIFFLQQHQQLLPMFSKNLLHLTSKNNDKNNFVQSGIADWRCHLENGESYIIFSHRSETTACFGWGEGVQPQIPSPPLGIKDPHQTQWVIGSHKHYLIDDIYNRQFKQGASLWQTTDHATKKCVAIGKIVSAASAFPPDS